MDRLIYVTGHRRPDTDSIVSPLAYAHLLRAQGHANVQPIRLGDVTPETQFILYYFRVEAPPLLTDLRLRVKDVMRRNPTTATSKATVLEVGRLLREARVRSIPIVDAEEGLVGSVTVEDFAKVVLDGIDARIIAEEAIPVGTLVESLGGCLEAGRADRFLRGNVTIAASSVATFQSRVTQGAIVIVGDRQDAQMAAIENGAGALVITSGMCVTPEVVLAAERKSVAVLTVKSNSFDTAKLINFSVPVRSLMATDVPTIHPEALLEEARHSLAGQQRSLLAVDDENRLQGIITRSNLLEPEPHSIVLMDHSERSQSVEHLAQLRLVGVIDHHRIGDIQTSEPILFRCEPVGCTATIVCEMYREAGLDPPKEMAGLMLSAILSDTLLYSSPTCTDRDRVAGNYLAALAGVDARTYGLQMLRAGEALEGMSARDVLMRDFKEFSLPSGKYGVGQFITADPSAIAARKEEIQAEMSRLREENRYEGVLLMVTDGVRKCTDLWVDGPVTRIASAFGVEAEDSVVRLPGVVSRKGQVVPRLTRMAAG